MLRNEFSPMMLIMANMIDVATITVTLSINQSINHNTRSSAIIGYSCSKGVLTKNGIGDSNDVTSRGSRSN
jgi:hypothetical protein